jgi:hypothetical protein
MAQLTAFSRRRRGVGIFDPTFELPEPLPEPEAAPEPEVSRSTVFRDLLRRRLEERRGMPQRRPDQGAGAYETETGEVRKPGRMQKVLGYAATALGGLGGGMSGAAREHARAFEGPYQEELGRWAAGESSRQKELDDLRALGIKEAELEALAPYRRSQIRRNEAAATRDLRPPEAKTPTVVDRYTDDEGRRVVKWSDGRTEVGGRVAETPTTSIQPTEGGGAVVVTAPRRGQPSAALVVMPPGTKLRKPGGETELPGGPASTRPAVEPGTRDEGLLKTLDAGTSATVRKIAEGKMALPSGFALKSPYWQRILNLVNQYDPSFDAVNYNSRFKTRQAFTSGTLGVQVNALNTAIGHLEQLSKKSEELKNWDTQIFNTLGNFLLHQTGDPRVANFRQVSQSVAQELVRVWRGTGGAEADIKERLKNLDTSNSPAQLHGSIAEIGDLLESKLDALQEQYRQGMGISDTRMITPQSDKLLEKLLKKGGVTRHRTGTEPAAPGARPPLSSFERR